MDLLILLLKIVFTFFLVIFALICLIWIIIKNNYINYIRKYGKKIKAKVIDSKVVSNRSCNGMPGYHYWIKFEWQDRNETESDKYTSSWRYWPKSLAIKMVSEFKINSYIEVYRDRDEANKCFPVSASKMVLAYPFSLLMICITLISIIIF